MNVTLRIGKVIRILGLLGIMLALVGFMAHAPSASAGRQADGSIVVSPIFPSSALGTEIAAVMVYNSNDYPVAKGTATNIESFVATLAPGGYTVKVSADGYNDYTETVKLSGGQRVMINAPLSPSAPDAVAYGEVVVRAMFPPIAGDSTTAQVVFWDTDGNAIAKGTADSESDFAVELAPGKYVVSLYAEGYNDYNEVVAVGSGDKLTIKVALTPVNSRMLVGK